MDMADDMKFRHALPVQIRFNDVDQYGHMNNSSYFSLYDLAKTSYMRDVFGNKDWHHMGIVVANINADFLAPVFFSDDLIIETTVIHLGHKSFTLLQRAINKASGVLKCQCRTVMVGYDVATKEPVELPADFKQAVCDYEGKSLEELSQPLK
jgi:acyl-CoA thioester hydrolase